jgi:predicted RNase H-like nuclease (RuvC/YqgF family)
MSQDMLIPVREVFLHHQLDITFADVLQEYELITVIFVEEQPFISESQLNDLEKLIRFHQELKMNIEGIDAVYRLSKKLEQAQKEIAGLKNRIAFYERGF